MEPNEKSAMVGLDGVSNRFEDPAEARLRELGYTQELKRDLNLVAIIGVASSVINPFITVVPFYGFALSYGGPAVLMWPWWPVLSCVLCLGLCLAEICSSFPTSGSIYYWSAAMCPPTWRSLVAWMAAYMECTALIVGQASFAFPAAQIIQQIILLATGGMTGGGYFASKAVFYAIYVFLIFTWAAINSFGIKIASKFLEFYVYFNFIFMTVLCVLLPVLAPKRQSAKTVYFEWETSPDVTGVHSNVLNVMFGALLAGFCSFGYDVAALVTEETKGADVAGPKALISAIVIEIVLGFAFLNVLGFCIQGSWKDLFSPDSATGGVYPVAQIIYDVFHGRFNNGVGACIVLSLMVIPFYASGVSGSLGASRAVYAFSRDGALPFSRIWRQVTKESKVPIYATWLVAGCAACFGLPNFGSTVAFNAIASVTTVSWVGKFAFPIFFRLIMDDKEFKRGPFHLGSFSRPLGCVSLVYIMYTMTMFMVPQYYPVSLRNFNYSPLVFFAIMFSAFFYWLIDARLWFKGPIKT